MSNAFRTEKNEVLIHRVPFTVQGFDPESFNFKGVGCSTAEDEVKVLVVDVETTGLDSDVCDVIEVGMALCCFSRSTGALSRVIRSISLFNEPTKPIEPLIESITGITQEMVAGHRILDSDLYDWFEEADVVAAFNAGFDFKFMSKWKLPTKPWVCAMKDPDWLGLGVGKGSLELMVLKSGYFYESHRAETDCLATIWLLHMNPAAVLGLLNAMVWEGLRIQAFGTPYSAKDQLAAGGYTWCPDGKNSNKHWWKDVTKAELVTELDLLDTICPKASNSAHIKNIDASDRFA